MCFSPNLQQDDRVEPARVEVYQLRVWLREISPLIWRRLLVRSDSTVADLHYTLQIAMGWTDTHLHQFIIRGKRYGVYQPGGISFSDDPTQVRLGDLRFRLKERFFYEYNFFDLWRHEIRFEQRSPLDSRRHYPVCVGGSRAAPPEGCGGPWGFMAFEDRCSQVATELLLDLLETACDLEVWKEKYLENQTMLSCWVNANCLDRRKINHRLEQYAVGDEAWRQQWEVVLG